MRIIGAVLALVFALPAALLPHTALAAGSWSIVTSPNVASANNTVQGVSCVSASFCMAVGQYNTVSTSQTLIEQWNGTAWSVVTSPNTSTSQNNSLYGVTCFSSTNCWAVGQGALHISGTWYDQTLAEQWNGTSWAIVTTADAGTKQANDLSGVSCASTSFCIAAGHYCTVSAATGLGCTGYYQTLIEQWNGTAWSVITSPDTSTTQNNQLNGVSCVSTSSCMAAGYYTGTATQTLIEQWNGTSWSIVTSANTSTTQYNYLQGVSCASASSCMAAGDYNTGTADQTLIEEWNGTAWSIVTSPNTSTGVSNDLYGVSCASATSCMAAGDLDTSGNFQTLIEQWNGTAWSIVTSPNTSTTQSNWLNGVSCVVASCMAAGYYFDGSYNQTLIEQYAPGASTTTVTSSSSPSTYGTSVTFTATVTPASPVPTGTITFTDTTNGMTLCSAVAVNGSGQATCATTGVLAGANTITASYSGDSGYLASSGTVTQTVNCGSSVWCIDSSPNTSTSQSNQLQSVSCFSATFCMAAGYYTDTGGYDQTLIEQWNGTAWSIVTSPNYNTTQNTQLYGVSCVSTTFCMAAGHFFNGGIYWQTLSEQWNGTAWSIVTALDTSTSQSNYLYGVSCTSATSCMAAGYYTGSYNQTLIEQWNGTAWSIVTSPNSSTSQNNDLYGVSCTSTTSCMAAGYYYTGSYNQTLIEQWNGTAWSIVTSPNTSTTQYNTLYGVSCTSTTSCMAAGEYIGTNNQTLIEQWNGTAWSIVTSPNVGTNQVNYLLGVSCASATSCMAAGYYNPGTYTQTLIEQWNGTAWSIVTSLNTSTSQNNELNGVSCGATVCMAAGYYVNSSSYDQTLIEEYTVASGGNLTITPPAAVNLGSSIMPGSAVSNAALGGLAYQNSLADGMSWSVTLAATDLYNSGNGKLVAFTQMKIGVGQTISPSGPTAGTAGPTALSGTDTTPGTSYSNSLTLASGTSAQQGSWTQTGNTITVNFPANDGNSGTMTSTIQYTITG